MEAVRTELAAVVTLGFEYQRDRCSGILKSEYERHINVMEEEFENLRSSSKRWSSITNGLLMKVQSTQVIPACQHEETKRLLVDLYICGQSQAAIEDVQ